MNPPDTASPSSTALQGIVIMIITMGIFAIQDGISRYLAGTYHPIFIVMIRYWAFAAFIIVISANRPGGLRSATRSTRPVAQMVRGLLLSGQICVVTYSFTRLGLAETHAILSFYPLLIAAGGAFFLAERVTLSQWIAIGVGFSGVLVLINPGRGVFDPFAIIPMVCAFVFAAYGLLTRWVARTDPAATTFFFTGFGGAIGMTIIGPFFWSDLASQDWLLLAVLCVIGAMGHYLLIKAYEFAEASLLQPFAYLQLGGASLIGVVVFDETLDASFLIGTMLIVSSGVYALVATRR